MRIMVLGDVVGRSGREGVIKRLPELREKTRADFVIVNGENAAGGFGITGDIARQLRAAGADVITTGNHVWDQREVIDHIDTDDRLLRPINFPVDTPGKGAGLFEVANGAMVLVMNVMGRLYMEPLDDPFATVERQIAMAPLKEAADAIVIDVHAEATSEKMAMGHFVDSRASLVIGTHTHVPTADAQILPGGTAYQTDLGMCGDYDSVIGMDKTEPLNRFVRKMSGGRFQPAAGEATVCGTLVETDDTTGLATGIQPIRVGGRLREELPV